MRPLKLTAASCRKSSKCKVLFSWNSLAKHCSKLQGLCSLCVFKNPIRWLALTVWIAGALWWPTAAKAGPLYFDTGWPTDPDIIVWNVTAAHPPDPGIPVEIITLSLTSALLPPSDDNISLPLTLSGSDSGGLTGPGTGAAVDFSLLQPPPADQLPAGTFVDLVTFFEPSEDIYGSDTIPFDLGQNINLVRSDSFFDIFFETTDDFWIATHRMHFEVGENQPFFFSNIRIRGPLSPAFSLSFILDGGGVVDPSNPLFTMTMTGEYTPVPEPATLILLGFGLAGLIVWRKKSGISRRED